MELRPDNIMATAMMTANLKEDIAAFGGGTYSPLNAGFLLLQELTMWDQYINEFLKLIRALHGTL